MAKTRKRRGVLITIPHPLRWIRNFCKALLYGPTWSPYEEMVEKYNEEFGITPGEKLRLMKETEARGQAEAPGAAQAPGNRRGFRQGSIGVGIPLMGYGPGGYSDKDDESYYGL